MNVFRKSDFFFWNLSHNAPLCSRVVVVPYGSYQVDIMADVTIWTSPNFSALPTPPASPLPHPPHPPYPYFSSPSLNLPSPHSSPSSPHHPLLISHSLRSS